MASKPAKVVISKTGNETLERIKKNISTSYLYFKPNYDRYHKFRTFVFKTSLEEQEKQVLIALQKPIIEFNILEAYISRLLGEFSKHEPSIEITPSDGAPVDIETIKIVEGHIRHILYEANKNSCSYEVYKDLLSGGFSTVKVWTDYSSSMSFNQVIKLGRVFDPTLCGFDPMARYSHKGDGRYCYELYPQGKEDFERENPGIDTVGIKYSRKISGFNWSYMNEKEEILLRAHYFEKEIKRTRIVKLADGRVMTAKNYEKFEQYWKDEHILAQIPKVIGKSRMSDLEIINSYKLIESEIFEHKVTDYTYLPLVFVDGNSIQIREGTSNAVQQMTRPYVYHAEGIQKLKNFAGQTLGNELENMIQHKIMIAEEALPQQEQYLEAYDNIQQASSYVYRSYNEENPDQEIPQPREVVRTPIPQEVMATYSVTDSTSQMILGTFDTSLGINDNQLSGDAIVEGATQSNAAAMPFVTGYLQAWTHVGCIIADLIPLYIVTPRTIPVVGIDGKRDYKKVNQPKGPDGKKMSPQLDYDQSALQIYVEAGVNWQIQKNQALAQLVGMMKASESFSAFMNGPGLTVLVDNLTIYGADVLKEMVPEWQKLQQQQAEEAKQQQQQMLMNDPRMIDAKTRSQEAESKAQADMAAASLAERKFEEEVKENTFQRQIEVGKLSQGNDKLKQTGQIADAKTQQDKLEAMVQMKKADVEEKVNLTDAAVALADHKHQAKIDNERLAHEKKMGEHESIRESVKLHHEIHQANKPEEEVKDESKV